MGVSVTWDNPKELSILVAKVKEVEYALIREYIDNSKEILHDLGAEINEKIGDDGEDIDCDIDDIYFQTDTVDN